MKHEQRSLRFKKLSNSCLVFCISVLYTAIVLLIIFAGPARASVELKRPGDAWLVVVYLPYTQEPIPYVKWYKIDKETCNKQAKEIFSRTKAGKTRAFCL